jgi:hypothetical protein
MLDESQPGNAWHGRRRAAMAASRPFPQARDRHLNCARLLPPPAGPETPLKDRARHRFSFLFLCFHRRLAPPLTAAAVEPSPVKATASAHSSHSCAPPRPLTPTNSARSAYTAISFLFPGERSHSCRLTVASHPRCLSAPTSCTATFAVSYSCSRSPPFSRY